MVWEKSLDRGQGWLNVGSFFMQSLQNSLISTLRSVGGGGDAGVVCTVGIFCCVLRVSAILNKILIFSIS